MTAKRTIIAVILLSFCFVLTGCGETMSGIGKDLSRMGKGVKTIFIRESE
jgi:predicted small secreted protein